MSTASSLSSRGSASEPGRAFVYLQIIPRNSTGAFVRSPRLDREMRGILEDAMELAHEQVLDGFQVEEIILDVPRGEAPKALLSYPLRSRGSEVWGSLHGVLDLESLQNKLGENTYTGYLVSVINKDGEAVLSSIPSLRKMNLSASPLVRNFLYSPQRITLAYDHPVDRDAGEVLGSMAPVRVFDWGMLMERPTSAAYAPVRVMQTRTFGFTAIAALISLGIGFTLSRRLITPLQNLASTTSQIAEGNLAVRATVRGEDEIALLGSNFNDMAANIEALVRKLKTSAAPEPGALPRNHPHSGRGDRRQRPVHARPLGACELLFDGHLSPPRTQSRRGLQSPYRRHSSRRRQARGSRKHPQQTRRTVG